MAAPVYQSDGGGVFAAANNNNAVTVPLPATRPVGSVLLLVAFCRLITATAPTITGYTLLFTWTSGTASGGRMWLYGRVCDGTESAPSVTPVGATGTTGDIFAAGITCYSGVDTSGGISAIFDGTPTVNDASGTTTCTYPALTTTLADSMVVRMLARFRDAVDTFTPTATWNERADLGSTNRTGGQFHAQDKAPGVSGAQASVTVAPSNTTAARYLAVTFALKPAPTPKISTLVDSFDTTIDTAKWNENSGTTVWENGRAKMTPDQSELHYLGTKGSIGPYSVYDLTGSEIVAQVDMPTGLGPAGTVKLWMVVIAKTFNKTNNNINIKISAGNISTERRISGSTISGTSSIAYSAVNHKWLRIRESAGTIYADASPDGTNWTNLNSWTVASTTWSIVEVFPRFYADYDNASDSGEFIYLDNVNVQKTTVGRISLADFGGTPGTGATPTVYVRARESAGAAALRLKLYEGSSLRAEIEYDLTSSFVDYPLPITAASITSWANLEVQFQAISAAGATVQISQVYLQAEAPTITWPKITLAAGLTLTPVLAQTKKGRAISAGLVLTPAQSDIKIAPRALSAGLTLTPAQTRLRTGKISLAASLPLAPALVKAKTTLQSIAAGLTAIPALARDKLGVFSPDEISGLTVWLDASNFTGSEIGAQERMDPGVGSVYSTGNYTLGTRFTPTANGQITHIRYWHGQACGQTHPLYIFDATTQAILASATDTPGGTGGWREIALPTPLNVVAGQTYIVAFGNGSDQFAYGSWPGNVATHLTSGGGCYTSGVGFPATITGTGGSYYYADVVFQPIGVVSSWPNLGSGPAPTFVGGTPSTRANALKGKTVVKFAINGGRLRMTGTGVDTAYTIAYVGRMYSATLGRVLNAYLAGVRDFILGWHNGSQDAVYDGAWGSPDMRSPQTTNWKLYSGDPTHLFSDGTQLSTISGGRLSNVIHINGYSPTGVEETCDCEIAEVLVYDHVLTTTERQQVESYLRNKWFASLYQIALSAGLSLVPGIANVKSAPRTLTTAMTVTPTLARVKTGYRAIPAALTMTPVLAKVRTGYISLSSGLILTSAVSRLGIKARTFAAGLTLTSAMTNVKSAPRAIAAGLTMTPAFGRKLFKSIPLTLTLTPTAAQIKMKFFTLPAGLTLTPALSAIATKARSFTAGLSLTSTVTMVKSAPRALSAGLTFVPVLNRKLFKPLSTPLTFTSALAAVKGVSTRYISIDAGLTLAVAVSRSITQARAIAAGLTLTPALARVGRFPRALAATLTMQPVVGRKLFKTITATLANTAALATGKFSQRAMPATLTLTPASSLRSTQARLMTVNLTLTPSFSPRRTVLKALSTGLTLTPTANRKLFQTMVLSVPMNPAMVKTSVKYRTIPAGLTLTAQIATKRTILRTLSAALSLVANLTRLTTHVRRFDASLGLSAALSTRAAHYRALSAGLTLTPGLSILKPTRISMPSTLVLTPNFNFTKYTGQFIKISLAGTLTLRGRIEVTYSYHDVDWVVTAGMSKANLVGAGSLRKAEIVGANGVPELSENLSKPGLVGARNRAELGGVNPWHR